MKKELLLQKVMIDILAVAVILERTAIYICIQEMGKIRSNKISCPNCKEENEEDSNFCANCGEKLKDVCSCWVIKKDSYSCGEKSYPGYKFFKAVQKNKGVKTCK